MFWTQAKCVQNATFPSVKHSWNQLFFSPKGAAEGPAIVMVLIIHHLQPPHPGKFIKENCVSVPSAIQCWNLLPRLLCNVNVQLHPKQRVTYSYTVRKSSTEHPAWEYIRKWIWIEHHRSIMQIQKHKSVIERCHPHNSRNIFAVQQYGHSICLCCNFRCV